MNCISTGHDFRKFSNETRNVGVDVLFKVIYLHFLYITTILNCQKIQVPLFCNFSSVNIFLQFKMLTVLVMPAVIPRTLYVKVTCAKVSHNMKL